MDILIEVGLGAEMPTFGVEHKDKSDAVAGMSGFYSSNSFPPDYEGGRFHWLELGLYVRLIKTVGVLFSGLRQHGGTPPRAPPGQVPDDKHVRFAVVLYPPRTMMDGKGIFNICAHAEGEPVRLVPEFTNMKYNLTFVRWSLLTHI